MSVYQPGGIVVIAHSDIQKNERKKGRRCVRERIPMAMASELLEVVQCLLVTTVRYYNT